MPLRRYFDFSGRSRRQEYWMFVLFQALAMIALLIVMGIGIAMGEAGNAKSGGEPGALFTIGLVLLFLFWLVMIIPTVAVVVRRLHDQDLSGWFYLLNFVPLGGLVVFVFMCIDGTAGENRFGPDPKGRGSSQVFA